MQITAEIFKSMRKVFGRKPVSKELKFDVSEQAASDHIKNLLLGDRPCMISRFGSNELDATLRAFERGNTKNIINRVYRYVRKDSAAFWWDASIRKRMSVNAGFFPTDDQSLNAFGLRMLKDITELDVLGSWRDDEWRLRHRFPNAVRLPLLELEPYRHDAPWSEALAGKRVLVLHPFVRSIENQYKRRKFLFSDPRVLPDFELITIKAVVSNAMSEVKFSSWFNALDHMCEQIREKDFDVAIIGAGAYGLPLAAFVKRLGKKAIHLGGATQLLFGISGQRWDEGNQHFYNEHWVRPLESEKPKRADLVESAAYW